MPLTIYEFSRELINISQKNGRWVSGGFGTEIGKCSHPVPEKIKQAVERADLRINDNYPPTEQKYALLAREIDEYSVLAVATREIDDKNRPLIAYRYFWLKKPDINIDGVGTLLQWWLGYGEPKFEFVNPQVVGKLRHHPAYYSRENTDLYFEQSRGYLVKIWAKIKQDKHYPFAFTNSLAGLCSQRDLHYLALQLKRHYGTAVAWAWNVGWLEHPEKFTLIYCADEQACNYITNDINTHKKLLVEVDKFTQYIEITDLFAGDANRLKSSDIPVPKTQDTLSTEANREESLDKHSPKNTNMSISTKKPNNTTFSNIKQCLLSLAKSDSETEEINLKRLIDYLDKYPIETWEWDNIVDKTVINNPPSPSVAKYGAILTLLGRIPLKDLLLWLKDLKNKSCESAALNTQDNLLKASIDYGKIQVYIWLKSQLFLGISQLLLACKSLDVDSQDYQYIQDILLKPNYFLYTYFRKYAKQLVFQLLRREENTVIDEFYSQVLADLKKWEEGQQQKLTYKSTSYQGVADLARKINNHSLAAFFYQLSGKPVPADVYAQVHVEIIPLTRRRTEAKKKPFWFLGLSLFLGFISVASMTWMLVSEITRDHATQNQKQEDTSQRSQP